MLLEDLPDSHQIHDIERAIAFVKRTHRWVAIDIGAHRGILSRHMLKHFERVIAFEPGPLAAQIDAPITVHQIALGAKSGRVGLKDGTENTGQRHVVTGDDIEIETLDFFGYGANFIKIDVEGMEFDVLLGAYQTLIDSKPVVMFEDNGLCERYGRKKGDAGKLLESWGARMVLKLKNDFVYLWP
jgi:FkbM family methyltransferase